MEIFFGSVLIACPQYKKYRTVRKGKGDPKDKLKNSYKNKKHWKQMQNIITIVVLATLLKYAQDISFWVSLTIGAAVTSFRNEVEFAKIA